MAALFYYSFKKGSLQFEFGLFISKNYFRKLIILKKNNYLKIKNQIVFENEILLLSFTLLYYSLLNNFSIVRSSI